MEGKLMNFRLKAVSGGLPSKLAFILEQMGNLRELSSVLFNDAVPTAAFIGL